MIWRLAEWINGRGSTMSNGAAFVRALGCMAISVALVASSMLALLVLAYDMKLDG